MVNVGQGLKYDFFCDNFMHALYVFRVINLINHWSQSKTMVTCLDLGSQSGHNQSQFKTVTKLVHFLVTISRIELHALESGNLPTLIFEMDLFLLIVLRKK